MISRKVSTISNLFRLRRPTTILWFIVPIVVFAIQGMFGGRLAPHVGKEVLVVQPALAYLDTSTPIVFPSRVIRVQATTQHRCPRLVFSSSALPYTIAMFPMAAPTTARPSAAKILPMNNLLISTSAQTFPSSTSIWSVFRCTGYYNKQTKVLSGQINKFPLLDNAGVAVYPPANVMHPTKTPCRNGPSASSNRTPVYHVATLSSLGASV